MVNEIIREAVYEEVKKTYSLVLIGALALSIVVNTCQYAVYRDKVYEVKAYQQRFDNLINTIKEVE